MSKPFTVGDYLIHRLQSYGVDHVFGVPGDYVLGFNRALEQSPIAFINTCDEQGAGFAADAYARVRGLGAVCVTYGVGGLKLANTTAQAYAELSPVVVISGAPGIQEQHQNALLHHRVRDFRTQFEVFDRLTVAAVVLDNPVTAAERIDYALAQAMELKRPVYIELPRDLVDQPCTLSPTHTAVVPRPTLLPEALDELMQETIALLARAKQPVIVAGVELHRYGLQETFEKFVSTSGIPFVTTLLAKSVVSERHPGYLGIYQGVMCAEPIRDYVEQSDCVMALGVLMTDVDMGVFTARLDPRRMIDVTGGRAQVHHHVYEPVDLRTFLVRLIDAKPARRTPRALPKRETAKPAPPQPVALGVTRMFEILGTHLKDNMVLTADPGDALFGAAELCIAGQTHFLSPAYYASLGFAVPAALGAQLADAKLRPLVLVGDGAFQMTGMELSTIVRYRLNPIVVVLNNGGYGTERPMQDGRFNDVLPWNFEALPQLLGAGRGHLAQTEIEFARALQDAIDYTDGYSIINTKLPSGDMSEALRRFTQHLGARCRA